MSNIIPLLSPLELSARNLARQVVIGELHPSQLLSSLANLYERYSLQTEADLEDYRRAHVNLTREQPSLTDRVKGWFQ